MLLWLYKIVNNKVCHDFQLIRVAETHRYPTRGILWFPTLKPTGDEETLILIDGRLINLRDIVREQESISRFKVELRRQLLSK
jgi:hypothetical protein